MTPVRPIRIAIAAMGGQGGGVLADWIVDMAEHAGWYAQSTSVPGVAQRTGATVYYLELFPRSAAPAKPPVMALMPVPGDVDIVIAGELVEAGRAVLRGLVTTDRTALITSSHRDYSLTERMSMGDGRTSSERLEDGIRNAARHCISFDMAALADQTGSVISAVMFGALAGSNTLPFTRAQFEETIRRGEVGVDSSVRAFAAGFDRSQKQGPAPESLQTMARSPESAIHPALQRMQQDACRQFPEPVHAILKLALPRLCDYQDLAYAREYVEMLQPVAGLDHRNDAQLAAETARHLALWMTYEDTVRVAQAKIQPDRLQRIRDEAGARPGQIVHVVEFLHPRVEEVCDTLPAGLGNWLLRTGPLRNALEFFCRKGRRIRTTTLPGFLLLYVIASLRPFRRRLLRHGREMAAIRAWIATIQRIAPVDYGLAVEIARCQRLVKGYGDTHARGLGNFNAIMGRLDAIQTSVQPAATLKQLVDAALADEQGVAFRDRLATL